MLTELVIACIFICFGIQIYYVACRRQQGVADEEIVLLD